MANEESQSTVIIWDADSRFRDALAHCLGDAGVRVVAGEVPMDVVTAVREEPSVSLLMGELDCPRGGEPLFVLLHREFPALSLLPVVAVPSVEGAVTAIRLGMVDYLLKENLTATSLAALVVRIVRDRQLPPAGGTGTFRQAFICQDPAMVRLLNLARKAAVSDATVLIQGESGTGKEVLARFIHGQSNRTDHPLVAINCAALPPSLLESELFGHEKGAFTGAIARKIGKFELAHGGTILLDEISEMDLGLQSKLLRVIQEGEVDRVGGRYPVPIDVRIIATTNRVIKEEVEAGTFRQDLYYRLNVIPLTIPPLRERRTDINLLLDTFIERYNRKNRKKIKGISPAARRRLDHYAFPGNVRELENIIERAVVLADGPYLEGEDLFLDEVGVPPLDVHEGSDGTHSSPALPLPVGTKLEDLERFMIFKTLQNVDNNRTHAARLLGISIRTLRNKLREYREQYGETPESEESQPVLQP